MRKFKGVALSFATACMVAIAGFGPSVASAQTDSVSSGSGADLRALLGARNVENILGRSGSAEGISLRSALQASVESNPKLLARRSAFGVARDSYLRSFAGLLPQLDLSASTGYVIQRNDSTIARYVAEESGKLSNEQRLTLSQLLYNGGVTSAKAEAEKFAQGARGEEIFSTAEDVGLTASQYFFEVIRNRGVVALCEANIAEHERITELTRVRETSGGGTMADVRQAEAALADAKARLVQAQQNLADAEAGYVQFFGVKAGDLAMPGELQGAVPQNLDFAVATALERNRSLKASQLGIQQKEKEVEAARGQFMPDIRAKLSAGRSDNTSGFEQSYHDVSGMLVLNFNLFSGGADTASLSKARNAKLQAEREAEDLRRTVAHDAKVAYNFFKATSSLLPILRDNVDTNAQVVSGYMDQFRMGKRTLLDLVSAQNSLFSAQQVYLNGITAHNFSYYRIAASSSSLLPSLGINIKVDAASTN